MGVQSIDLRRHTATHPRLGAVDHISCHPLGPAANLQAAAALAHAIGSQLALPPTGLPVYYYGAASSSGRRLADIRRRLGEWMGG
jgi:glutamate formiminotransferase